MGSLRRRVAELEWLVDALDARLVCEAEHYDRSLRELRASIFPRDARNWLAAQVRYTHPELSDEEVLALVRKDIGLR